MVIKTDILVIGAGIAGLSFALKASREFNVVLICKKEVMESNTRYAQGGIASVIHQIDKFESHIQDTLIAGANLCNEKTVEKVVCAGPHLIEELLQAGVRFTKSSKTEFDLGREGGHSQRRILHASDITGLELQKKLVAKVKKSKRIQILENHTAVDLIVSRHLKQTKKMSHIQNDLCFGAYILTPQNKVITVRANQTILCTGGAGKTYLYTSNPDIATGDGIAMAYRAGCKIANLEFVQFHPTCLYHPQAKAFLISEALRGEGGVLKLQNGYPFMSEYHKMADLAPRDIVARAIDHELKKRGGQFVTLDMTHKSPNFLKSRFPTIYKVCKKFGIDMAKQPIPVVPAAHYFCGGIKIDLHGKTHLSNLYAIGEVSCSGLHGANRLASNSLLEGLAFADFAYKNICKNPKLKTHDFKIKDWDSGKATDSDEAVVITQNWDEIRRYMWNYVGIVRSNKRLKRAFNRNQLLQEEIKEYYWNFKINSDLVELRNIALVSRLVIESALQRKESVGLHYNSDYPHKAKNSKKYNCVSYES